MIWINSWKQRRRLLWLALCAACLAIIPLKPDGGIIVTSVPPRARGARVGSGEMGVSDVTAEYG
jgi:hypothetical protein